MEGNISDSVLDICRLLAKHGAEYMLVGGTAVALYGYYRHSINISGELTDKPDIDLWYNPTYSNYFRILNVIKDLGQDVAAFAEDPEPNPTRSFFKLDFEDFSLDILPSIKAAIKFSDAESRKETIEAEGIPIHFLGYRDLIEDKNASARSKDLEDIMHLKKLREED